MSCFLCEYKDAVSTIESLARIAALFVAGWWTWIAFIRKRVKYPSAKIEHLVNTWADAGRIFVHLSVRINNSGSVLMRVTEGCAWLEQLTPLPSTVHEKLEAGSDTVESGRIDTEWQMLQQRNLPKGNVLEIEPGENDQLDFDFTIDPRIRRVLVYSHLANQKKKRGGWNLTTIHEIREGTLLP